MRYEVIFRTPREDSGPATYLAKKFDTTCPPYQFVRPNDYAAQNFIFPDYDTVLKFLIKANEEFGERLIIESIVELKM